MWAGTSSCRITCTCFARQAPLSRRQWPTGFGTGSLGHPAAGRGRWNIRFGKSPFGTRSFAAARVMRKSGYTFERTRYGQDCAMSPGNGLSRERWRCLSGMSEANQWRAQRRTRRSASLHGTTHGGPRSLVAAGPGKTRWRAMLRHGRPMEGHGPSWPQGGFCHEWARRRTRRSASLQGLRENGRDGARPSRGSILVSGVTIHGTGRSFSCGPLGPRPSSVQR